VRVMPLYSEPPPGELAGYVRRNFLHAAIAILALLAFLAVSATWFEQELLALTHGLYNAVGLPGLLAIVFFNDIILTPLPPEAMLVVVAKTGLRESWPLIILVMGLLSAAAGNTAWWLGRSVGDRFFPILIEGVRLRHGKLIHRYGGWAVGLSALTPLPFSLTCLAAGALRMQYQRFWGLTLLRVPRFFLFYLMIAYSDRLFALF